MGDVHFKKGEEAEAFHQYNEAVRRYAKDSLYSNAIAVCRKMLRLDAAHIDAYRLLGDLYLEQGFGGEAVGYLLEYAGKLIEKGDLDRAADSLRKIIESAPGRVKVREQLAEVYTHLGLKDEARSELFAASEIYEETGDKEMAERLKARAEEMGGGPAVAGGDVTVEGHGSSRVEIVHKRIGLAHHVPLKIEEVLSSFKEEIKKAIGEEDYQCHYDLGISYIDLGFFDEALAEFGVSRKNSDLALRSIEMAGRCFMEKGDVEMAIEELNAGLDMEGHSEQEYLGLRYSLALALETMGQKARAVEHFEEICRTDPDFRDARTRMEQLSKG
jgi:tetratricopeptide (TPR) repeat protein